MIDLGTLGGVSGRANALNNAGVVVGLSGAGGVGGFDYHAFVYGPDGMLDLNALVGERGDWQLVNALDVNDAGQILAQACNGPGDCRAVRLDLVTAAPEPGTWAMLGPGLALLALARAPALLIGPLAAPGLFRVVGSETASTCGSIRRRATAEAMAPAGHGGGRRPQSFGRFSAACRCA